MFELICVIRYFLSILGMFERKVVKHNPYDLNEISLFIYDKYYENLICYTPII